MKKNKLSALAVASIALAVLLIQSCSSEKKDFTALIPEDAYAYVQINNTETFMDSLDAIIKQSSFSGQMGGMGIKTLLSLALSASSTNLSLDDLDLEKPMGLAILPSSDDFGAGFAVYLPSKDPDALNSKLQDLLEGDMNLFSEGDYSVLVIDAPSYTGKPEKALTIPAKASKAPEALVVYFSLDHYIKNNQAVWDSAKEEIINSFEEEVDEDPAMAKQLTAFFEAFFKVIEATDSSLANLYLKPGEISGESFVSFDTDSETAKILAKLSKGQIKQDFFEKLPADTFFDFASSLDPESFKDISKDLVKLLVSALDLDSAEAGEYEEIMEKSLKLAGKNQGFSMALHLDLASLENLYAENLSYADLKSAIDIRAYGFQEVSDTKAYSEFLKSYVDSPILNKLFTQSLENFFTDPGLSLENRKQGEKEILQLKMHLGDPVSTYEDEYGSDSFATNLLQQFIENLYMAYLLDNNKVYWNVSTESGDEDLVAFANGKLFETSLKDNEQFASYLKSIPKDSQIIWRLNYLNLLSNFSMDTEDDSLKDLGLAGYVLIENNEITSGFRLAIPELIKVLELAMTQMGGLF